MDSFGRKIQITIDETQPYLFKIADHHLFIGGKLIAAPGHLEKAIAKIWFREQASTSLLHQDLLEEIVTDLLIYLNSGELNIGDPDNKMQTAIEKLKWPYAIKPIQDYCESPWRQSEHYSSCEKKDLINSNFKTATIDIGLRSLLSGNLVRAFKKLSPQQRFGFLQDFPKILQFENSRQLNRSKYLELRQDDESVLNKMADALNDISFYMTKSDATKNSAVLHAFANYFEAEMATSAFKGDGEAKLDFLYIGQNRLNSDSLFFKHFTKFAEHNQTIQIAVKDEEKIWLLPSKYPFDSVTFGKVMAKQTIVEICGDYDFRYILGYADRTDKLLVVKNCGQQEIKYSRFLKDGPDGFAKENNGVNFVQFHLPSLLMRKSELQQVSNVFNFLKVRDTNSPSFKSLGWQDLNCNKFTNVYQPKASVDAIEWFRVTD
ncbi:MAG: hypothetical protein ACXWRR_06045 [Bdellovibrio sp.]